MAFGTSATPAIGVTVALLSCALGTFAGPIAGYFRLLDTFIMRFRYPQPRLTLHHRLQAQSPEQIGIFVIFRILSRQQYITDKYRIRAGKKT